MSWLTLSQLLNDCQSSTNQVLIEMLIECCQDVDQVLIEGQSRVLIDNLPTDALSTHDLRVLWFIS